MRNSSIAAKLHNKYHPLQPFVQRGRVSLRPLERTALFLLYDTADSGPGIIGAEPNVAYAGARNGTSLGRFSFPYTVTTSYSYYTLAPKSNMTAVRHL